MSESGMSASATNPATTAATAPAAAPAGATVPPADAPIAAESPWQGVWRDILGGGVLRSVLAILLALLIGSLLVVATSEDVQAAAGYFVARPGDTFAAAGKVIAGAFRAIWEGAVFSPRTGFQPFTQTLMWSTPLISAGLGIAIGFRAGLFNIGGRGQMLLAALFVGFIGASAPMPPVVHLLVAVLAGILGGALWAAVVGWLKAQTGAHEVISTIMLNYVAFWGVTYLLKTPIFQAEGAGGNPKAKPILETAALPDLIGSMDLGFILSILAVIAYWWIMDRSTIGFRIRAVGFNPSAARTAGINVERTTIITMALSGAFLGLAGATQVLGRATNGYTPDVDAGIGFDAITVALLGGNHPVGIVLAGLLFGALKAGSFPMQVTENIPIDIVAVIQGLIVLFIAAPPLIRAIFRLPQPTGVPLLDRFRISRGTKDATVAAAAAGVGSAVEAAPLAAVSSAASTPTGPTAPTAPLAAEAQGAEVSQAHAASATTDGLAGAASDADARLESGQDPRAGADEPPAAAPSGDEPDGASCAIGDPEGCADIGVDEPAEARADAPADQIDGPADTTDSEGTR